MKPVEYSNTNQPIVDSFNDLPKGQKSADYWNQDEVKPVRKQIKNHYITEQQQKCCYCNVHFPTKHNMVWDAEHVIPRTTEPRFLFEPRNLAIACKDCNCEKSDKEVRVNPGLARFPDESADYKIVHPHFDDYSTHIRWIGTLCKPESKKGIYTIEACGLLRLSLNPLGEKVIPSNLAVDRQIGILVDMKDRDAALMALDALRGHMERIPQK